MVTCEVRLEPVAVRAQRLQVGGIVVVVAVAVVDVQLTQPLRLKATGLASCPLRVSLVRISSAGSAGLLIGPSTVDDSIRFCEISARTYLTVLPAPHSTSPNREELSSIVDESAANRIGTRSCKQTNCLRTLARSGRGNWLLSPAQLRSQRPRNAIVDMVPLKTGGRERLL